MRLAVSSPFGLLSCFSLILSVFWKSSISLVSPSSRASSFLGNNAQCQHYRRHHIRSEEHTSELQSLMRISYAVFCLNKKKVDTFVRNSPASMLMIKKRQLADNSHVLVCTELTTKLIQRLNNIT